MRIGVDIDGVLADFNKAFIERVIHVTRKDLFPRRPFDIPTWNYPEHYGYSAKEVDTVWWHIINDTQFWARLPAYADTNAALRYLGDRISCHGDDVYFITARPGLEAKAQTEAWLLGHWPLAHVPELTVLISQHKGMCAAALDLDVYIDDRDLNVTAVALCRDASQTRVLLMDRPWNRDFDVTDLKIRRVTSVVGIAEYTYEPDERLAA